MSARRWTTRSPAETRTLGRQLAEELRPGGILLLRGDLAAGKTVLAQGVGEALGIAAEEVQSPTFTIVREHQGPGGSLVHLDLYRLSPEQASALGLEELLAAPAIKVIEWAERLPFAVPASLELSLTIAGEGEREIVDEGGAGGAGEVGTEAAGKMPESLR